MECLEVGTHRPVCAVPCPQALHLARTVTAFCTWLDRMSCELCRAYERADMKCAAWPLGSSLRLLPEGCQSDF